MKIGCILYKIPIKFYEIKKPTGKVSKLQQYRIKELKEYGFTAEVHYG